ncbi:MAG: hypothetical protein ACLP6G_10550 [Terriglobales bacterium]
MNGKWSSIVVLVAAAALLVYQPSCARSQQLVSVAVNPQGTTITLTEVGQQVGTQFTALGTYIHPPETKDLTNKAVWATDSPSIIAVVPATPGLINTTGNGCGSNLGVTASVYTDNNNPSGNVVVGSATMNVSFGSGSCL